MKYPWNWPIIAADGLLIDVRVAGLQVYIETFMTNWLMCFFGRNFSFSGVSAFDARANHGGVNSFHVSPDVI